MSLADARSRFLFELRPDEFPEGYLTEAESGLWARYYERREAERKRG